MSENRIDAQAKVGTHGFSGMCAPKCGEYYDRMESFSLGVFEWVPKPHER